MPDNNRPTGHYLAPKPDVPPPSDPYTSERLAPHSVEAEEALLGSLLLDETVYFDVAALVNADDFFILRNAWVFEAMVELVYATPPMNIDNLTVADRLQAKGRLTEIGGSAYLTYLINSVPTSLHAKNYARVVADAADRRRLLNAASEIANFATNPNLSPLDAQLSSQRVLEDAAESRYDVDTISAHDAVSALFDEMEYLYQNPVKDRTLGLATGLADLDKVLNGLKADYAYFLAAPTGYGKTSAVLSFADAIASNPHDTGNVGSNVVAFVSYEMSATRLIARLVCARLNIDSERLRNGDLSEDEWAAFVAETGRIAKLPIHFIEARGYTITKVNQRLEALRRKVGRLGLIVIDHLREIEREPSLKYNNRADEIGYICRKVKSMTSPLRDEHGNPVPYHYGCPVILVGQYNRDGSKKTGKPSMYDFADSSQIEQSVDCVIHIYSEKDDPIRSARFLIEKHRDGRTDMNGILVFYDPKCYRWRNITKVEYIGYE